jgi:hypothetical protein
MDTTQQTPRTFLHMVLYAALTGENKSEKSIEYAGEWNFQTKSQEIRAKSLNAVFIMKTRYYQHDKYLPKYVKETFRKLGFECQKIGGTTNKNSLFAVYRPEQH